MEGGAPYVAAELPAAVVKFPRRRSFHDRRGLEEKPPPRLHYHPRRASVSVAPPMKPPSPPLRVRNATEERRSSSTRRRRFRSHHLRILAPPSSSPWKPDQKNRTGPASYHHRHIRFFPIAAGRCRHCSVRPPRFSRQKRRRCRRHKMR
ncbi:hypothetical protein PIB30_032568, partial [Stylosanthes scabra]|nr:hypothetical protein [Stylosanthes scabra]